jgi:hypothetical protein
MSLDEQIVSDLTKAHRRQTARELLRNCFAGLAVAAILSCGGIALLFLRFR